MNRISAIIMKKTWKINIPILLLSTFIYTWGVGLFLTSAHAFPKGLGAFSQLMIYAYSLNSRWFFLFYFVTNLPLFIIFWKSLGKKFIIYTLVWMILQVFWGQLIFWFDDDIDKNPFNFINLINNPAGRIAYGVAAALLIGISTGLAFITGGSTGGIDFFVYYYYLKYKKSIGFYSVSLSLIAVFISMVIQFIMGKSIEKHVFRLFFGTTMFITILYLFIYSAILNTIYPRHKKIKVEIYSVKYQKIIDNFIKTKFHHGFYVKNVWNPYTNTHTKTIVTIISYMELNILMKRLYKIDSLLWVNTSFVNNIFGNFSDKLLTD